MGTQFPISLQQFQNVLKKAANSGKVGGCDNAKIVCHELIVMTRVAGDIQSSSRWNSGSRWLVLKPLSLSQLHGPVDKYNSTIFS